MFYCTALYDFIPLLRTRRIRESQSKEFLLIREITNGWNGKTVAYSSFKDTGLPQSI